jgi:hypothetical protein
MALDSTAAATCAAAIVSALGTPPQGVTAATAEWTIIVGQIFATIKASGVVTGLATAVQTGASTAPVTGTIT